VDIEGGLAAGEISRGFLQELDDKKYTTWDLSGRWKKFLSKEIPEVGGLNGFEIAAGITGLNTDADNADASRVVRLGGGIYFGKRTRLQSNLEFFNPADEEADDFWSIRSQFTVNL
jgi:hypothetical protein